MLPVGFQLRALTSTPGLPRDGHLSPIQHSLQCGYLHKSLEGGQNGRGPLGYGGGNLNIQEIRLDRGRGPVRKKSFLAPVIREREKRLLERIRDIRS